MFGFKRVTIPEKVLKAAETGDLKTVQKFYADGPFYQGYYLNVPPISGGKTSLYAALENNHKSVADFLMKWMNLKNRTLYYAVTQNNFSIVECMLDNGADVNMLLDVESGRIILHKAAELGNMRMVQFLVSRGANISAEARNGDTPVNCADDAGWKDIVQFLERTAIVTQIKDMSGDEISHMKSQQTKLFQQLLALGIVVQVTKELDYKRQKQFYETVKTHVDKQTRDKMRDVVRATWHKEMGY